MKREHEIPEGSKLYFGASAALKRRIETVASELLSNEGYEEIVTPLFSYHQHLSISDDKELIRVNDKANHNISLRADSTIDVVRIINKRLGKNTSHKKWFYVQPVFRFPTTETYQVGAEFIGESNVSSVLNSTTKIFENLDINPLIQISNINIPHKLCEILDLELEDFRHINVQKFLSLGIDWLDKLVYLHKVEQIDEVIAVVPDSIKVELEKIKELCLHVEYKNKVVAPMYYAKMLYYDELFFRVIDNNDVFARGGRYQSDDITSVGFALYTDELVEAISKKEDV